MEDFAVGVLPNDNPITAIMQSGYNLGYDTGYRAGIKAAQPKWISVKDNPPDGTKDVIAYNAFGEMMIGRVYETSRGRYKCEDGYSEDMLSVTHWMPLPQAPEVEKDA